MPSLRASDGYSCKFYGSGPIKVYPEDKIYEEAAFLAYYMHWSHEEIMKFSHLNRIRWCSEISKINSKLNEEPENMFQI